MIGLAHRVPPSFACEMAWAAPDGIQDFLSGWPLASTFLRKARRHVTLGMGAGLAYGWVEQLDAFCDGIGVIHLLNALGLFV